MKQNLDWFLASAIPNAWLKEPNLQIYVRRTFRYADGEKRKTFDIANVTASPRGKGTFTKFLAHLEQELRKTDFELIYIENVVDERFRNFLLRQGYKPTGIYGLTQCFGKELNQCQ